MYGGGYGQPQYVQPQGGYYGNQYTKGQQYSYGGGMANTGGRIAENCATMCCASFCSNMAFYVCCDCLTPGGFFWFFIMNNNLYIYMPYFNIQIA